MDNLSGSGEPLHAHASYFSIHYAEATAANVNKPSGLRSSYQHCVTRMDLFTWATIKELREKLDKAGEAYMLRTQGFKWKEIAEATGLDIANAHRAATRWAYRHKKQPLSRKWLKGP